MPRGARRGTPRALQAWRGRAAGVGLQEIPATAMGWYVARFCGGRRACCRGLCGRLPQATDRPSASGQGERSRRSPEPAAELLAQRGSALLVERAAIGAAGADAGGKRPPGIVERCVFRARRELPGLDLLEAGAAPEPTEPRCRAPGVGLIAARQPSPVWFDDLRRRPVSGKQTSCVNLWLE